MATRTMEVNGLDLAVVDAVDNVAQFFDDMELLREDAATTRLLLESIGQGSAVGKQCTTPTWSRLPSLTGRRRSSQTMSGTSPGVAWRRGAVRAPD